MRKLQQAPIHAGTRDGSALPDSTSPPIMRLPPRFTFGQAPDLVLGGIEIIHGMCMTTPGGKSRARGAIGNRVMSELVIDKRVLDTGQVARSRWRNVMREFVQKGRLAGVTLRTHAQAVFSRRYRKIR